jgi:hypothetical protein
VPIPLTSPGRWVRDSRRQGRAVRVSAHTEAGFLVLSTWKAGACVGTVHLLPEEAADLVAGLADGLAELTRPAVLEAAAGESPVPGDGSVPRLLPGR